MLKQVLAQVVRGLRGGPRHSVAQSRFRIAASDEALLGFPPPAGGALADALRLYRRERDAEAALQFRAAHSADPGLASRLIAAAEADKAAGKHESAAARFFVALQLAPHDASCAARLADTLYLLGEQEQALAALRGANASAGDDAWRVKDLIMRLPPVYRSMEHLRAVRESYLSGLRELHERPLRIANPFGELRLTNFYLAYQGMNERETQTALASVLLRGAPALAYQAPSLERRTRSGRLRVGFVSRYLGRHSVGMCYNLLISGLAARPELEVTVALLSGKRAAEATEMIPGARVLVLPGHLHGVRQALSELSLDVLVFTDIGMEPSTYLLAFGRFAPIQAVLAGHPLTTGIPTVDLFISSQANESAAADAHYSERLVRLRGIPVAIAPPPEVPACGRDAFGLPDSAHLYTCPMKLQKLHPEFDDAIAGILEADPKALILLFDDDLRSRWGRMVRARLASRLERHAGRVRFLPWMPFGRLLQLLGASDVVLDTFHFGAGTTAFYALASGCPVVTLPSAYLRGRHTLGYYTKMEMLECVAREPADYVNLAVRIGADRPYQHALRKRIAERRQALLGHEAVVEEFAGMLLERRAAA